MGGTGLFALGSATGGRWAEVGQPYYRALAQTVPLIAILFLPIATNMDLIYPWADHATNAEHSLAPSQAFYLERTFFFGRAVAYFVIWLVVAFLLSWQTRREAGGNWVGPISLVLLAPTVTFAAFDWGMSLEPHWYSSIYGAILTAGGVLAAHSLTIIGMAITNPAAEGVLPQTADASHDFGNLLLAFLMVFTYFSFSQFLIIWFGNLPREVTWYVRRLHGGWQWLALAIVVFHFVIPFLSLLSRDLKRAPGRVARVAALLLVMYVANIYWTIVPAFPSSGTIWLATNLAALAALAGGLLTVACWLVRRALGDDGRDSAGQWVG
jgi:hypothetical protein